MNVRYCETKARLEQAPEGRLRLSRSHNHLQYYCCTDENRSGSYIARENIELAKKLAQKAYDEKVLQLAEKRLSQIQKITKDYADDELEKLYSKEHADRQKLIKPVETTWEGQLQAWRIKEYQGKDFQDGAPVILTEKGERVRSKSAKIIWMDVYILCCHVKREAVFGTVLLNMLFCSRKIIRCIRRRKEPSTSMRHRRCW